MGEERLGRYILLKHLASGGMADVLLGRTDGIEGFERHVVVKRIRAEHAKDERFIQMFVDEARLAAGLHHQNIVQVHDIGEANGEYFFAMEYIHGEDLRKILSAVSKSRSHMPLGYVVSIITAAAAGLHYAHERRGADKKALHIVHRDVSPSNILLGYDGSVKVVDFGIAKAAMRSVETKSGSLKGKVSYMSPEQCKGEGVDRRSDVYALGVVLYELATTTRLFKGDNDYLLMDAIVNGKVPLPRIRRPDLPNDLSAIIMRAVNADASRRYQTADELRVALDQFVANAGLQTATSSLSSYMTKLFGDKPEPWLETSGVDLRAFDGDARTEMMRNSWVEVEREEMLVATSASAAAHEEAKTRTDGSRRRTNPSLLIAEAAPSRTTRTSTKMAWENQGTLPPPAQRRGLATRTKLALAALPMLAIAGIAAWQLLPRDAATDVARAPATAPAPELVVAPPPAPIVTPPDPPAPIVTPAPDPPTPEPAASAKPTVHAAIKAPPKRPKPTAIVAPAPAPIVAPEVVAAVAVPPPVADPVPAPPPPPVEPVIAQLSNATISAVASDHARQLAKCEGSDDLHGEVSIAFQIDAAGKVVKSQMSSTIKNPKLSGCILRTLQSWQFPKPPSGAAKGLYTIAYQ